MCYNFLTACECEACNFHIAVLIKSIFNALISIVLETMNNSISFAFANLLLGALHSFLLKKQQQQKQKHYKKQTDPGTVGPTVISALKNLNKET